MSGPGNKAGKFAYAFLFVVVVPALLMAWALATADVVPLPVPPFRSLGLVLAVVGTFLMATGTWALWVHGGGLPMSPYPPPNYVSKGIYGLTPHPIYAGFTMLCYGVSITAGSASGLWLVSPAVALGCAALVMGFERHELRRRFGEEAVRRTLISLPVMSRSAPSGWDRLSVGLLVLLPWLLVFESVYLLGVPPDAVEAYLPFERDWPVWEWTEAIYVSAYLFVPLTLFVAPTTATLRHFAIVGLIATVVVTLIYLAVPLIATPRPFEPDSLWGRMLMFERELDVPVAAFPAFHVIWALIAADAWADRSRVHGFIGRSWAILIAVSCVTTGMHALVDVVAALLFFVLLRNYGCIWELLRRSAERVANSWRAWQTHKVRLINYGLYAGLGAFLSLMVSSSLCGPDGFWPLVVIHVVALVSAGLWAQTLEGSPKLSRPFGYYGSVLGTLVATFVVGAYTGSTLQLGAAIAIAAPWVQAIGRMRCLVQGCCHGAQAGTSLGIRYWGERSRVCALADLRGVPLHPTPLYSMLANLVIGVVLLRLWSLGAAYSLIAGAYLILSGIARFVEESYRGEPQTPIIGPLRIYQWLAMLSFVLGAVLTTVPSAAAPGLAYWLDAKVLLMSTLYGLLTVFAMGVDFPGSDKRFARLAPP